MAVVPTGSILTFLGTSANAGTVSSTITVPADAELVVGAWGGFSTTANMYSGGSMTFTKGGVDTVMTGAAACDSDTGKFMAAMFYLALPDTGTNKTWKWDWAGAGTSADGFLFSLAFFKGNDTTSPVRDSKAAQAAAVPYTTASLTAVSGDLIIAWVASSVITEGTVDSWSNLTLLSQVSKQNNADGAWATGSPSGNTTVAASTATNFADGGIIAISVKQAQVQAVSPGTSGASIFRARQFSSLNRKQIYG